MDIGQEVENVMEVDMTNLPSYVVDIPAMALKCSLVREEDGYHWSKEALKDWEVLVHDRKFELDIVDEARNIVDLTEGCVPLIARLVFPRHVPPSTETPLYQQHFVPHSQLSNLATLCCDYEQISPRSILLYFEKPLLLRN